MIRKYTLLFLLSYCWQLCYAQTVTIQGSAKAYENKEIGVWVYKDYISTIEKRLTFSGIDSTGNFMLEFDSKTIQYITLKIEKSIASMYIEPGVCYEVEIMPPDSTTYQNPNLEHDVKIAIKLKSKTEINALTIDYDKRFDDFLSNEYPAFVSRAPKQKIDSFKTAISDFYSMVNNNYFKNYITYSIAALEEKTHVSSKKLYTAYLKGHSILYDNPEYFNFFNTFYKNYLQNYAASKKGADLSIYIDKHCDYTGIMNVLKQDEFLENDSIRDLVIIKGLYESYYDGSFKRDSIKRMLEQIRDESVVPEHKAIAQNILNSFSKLTPGASAPFFELPDKTGLTHSLDELRAKRYLYLVFFKTGCTTCLQQMKVFSSLKKNYGKHIEFVGICIDKDVKEFKTFCKQNAQYNWLLLYDNTGEKLKEAYEIASLPTYFLINPEGKFVQAPADGPEEYIERTFYDITKPAAKKVKVGDKKNK